MILDLPSDPVETTPRWHKLFFQGEFFSTNNLSELYALLKNDLQKEKKKLPDDPKKALNQFLEKDYLLEWNDFQVKNAGKDIINRAEWGLQIVKARELIKLAKLAFQSEEVFSTEDFKLHKELGKFYNTYNYAAYLLLKGKPRHPEFQQKINVLLEVKSNYNEDEEFDPLDHGKLCELEINLFTTETEGIIYPDPKINTLFEYEEDFIRSVEEVWNFLRNEFGEKVKNIDASFSLKYEIDDDQSIDELLWGVSGPSAMAAFYLCLRQAFRTYLNKEREFELNSEDFAISAELDLENGKLIPVGGLKSKLKEAVKREMSVIIVAEENKDEAKKILEKKSLKVEGFSEIGEVINWFNLNEKRQILEKESDSCKYLEWFGKSQSNIQMKDSFQLMPMLITVKKDDLISKKNSREDNIEFEKEQFSENQIRQWEEDQLKLREYVTETSHSISEVFNNFQNIVRNDRVDFHQISEVPRLVMLGSPGAGKSTFCKYLTWACEQQSKVGGLKDIEGKEWKIVSLKGIQLVPARIKLTEWESDFLDYADSNPSKEFRQELHNYLASIKPLFENDESKAKSADKWKTWLNRGEVLLLFDGLDEIKENQGKFISKLKTIINDTYKTCPVIITCRTVSYETHRDIIPNFPIFTLGGLTDEQQDNLIKAYLENLTDEEIEFLKDWIDDTNLQLLATNPLLLSIICFVVKNILEKFEKKEAEEKITRIEFIKTYLPTTRSRLYQDAITNLLRSENWKDRQDTSIKLSVFLKEPDEKLKILKPISFELWSEKGSRQLIFREKQLLDLLVHFGKEHDKKDLQNLFFDLTRVCGIFVGGKSLNPLSSDINETFYSFLHLTVHEYLVASSLAEKFPKSQKVNIREFLGDSKTGGYNLYDVTWSEVLAMLGGALAILDEKEKALKTENDHLYSPRAESYISSLLVENKQDMFYRPFFTAVAAAVETGDKIKPETKKYLFDKSMNLYFNPPDYLENEFFLPLVRIWNNDAVEYLRDKLRDYLKNHESESD